MGKISNSNANFGTLPVFMTAISTILGAILFLRFGWAVGQVGFFGVIGIILIGHLITFPTALAIAEIATNQKVQGGGAYYIISRSFGLNVGAAIGITLFLSQAVSVAFYVIAFAEAFDPVIEYMKVNWGIHIFDKRFISLPSMAILSLLILSKGANVGMKALYVVVFLLFASIIMFIFGTAENAPETIDFSAKVANPESFFYVFTIVFPAFTGLAAGLGLSGDLKDPKKSIPAGTLIATVVGMVIYAIIAYKFAVSASPDDLASNQLIMQDIAIWGPIVPIGLAAASLSSALGSILVAPRTLQAIGLDNIVPSMKFNEMFSKESEKNKEPVNATLLTIAIAFFFIAIGDVNFVAEIISMFFMVTYGAICMVSFFEHFAADPAYRPTFRSRWYFSLLGGVLSFWLMFKMNSLYAFLSLIIMAILYMSITVRSKEKRGLEKLFRGVIFQLSRHLQIFAQRADKEDREVSWRPFVVCVSQDSFKRRAAYDMIRWMSYKYGSGTYIHYIKGYLTRKTNIESQLALKRLINLDTGSRSRVFMDTIISPSMTSALAQVIQLSNISGKVNNMILFEFSRTEPEALDYAVENYSLLESTSFDVCILNTSYKGFGYKRNIHIWISAEDYENANLMILLGYILLGHPEWKKGVIKIFALTPSDKKEQQKESLLGLINSGRLPISRNNVEIIPYDQNEDKKSVISRKSIDADFTILGFNNKDINGEGMDYFTGFQDMGNLMFVNAFKEIEIK